MSDSGREWPSELSDAEYLLRFGRPREDKPAEPNKFDDNYSEAAAFAGITFSQACQFDMYMKYLLGKLPAPSNRGHLDDMPAEPLSEPIMLLPRAIRSGDKSEGVAPAGFPEPSPTPSELPVDEKFSIWLDEEGDYIVQCNRSRQFLTAHGASPDEAIYMFRGVLDMAASSDLGGDLATDLDYQGPMPHVDALSNSKLGRVNYLNDRSYPDHTATCTVCGSIAKLGGKCESCGSDKLSELRGAGEAAKPEQLISRKLVLIAISELSTQSDGSSEWQAFQNGLAASIMAVLAIQPSPSPDSAAPELPRGVEDVLLRPDSGSLPSLDIRPEDRGPDVTYIGMERVLLERQNCRERQLREALRELASLRERLGVR